MSVARILVVDDEPLAARAIARTLDRSGHRVDTALDGRSALERLDEVDFDLVLCDVRMPGMSGADVLRVLGSRARPHPTFVMITGYSDHSEEDLVALGAAAVYGKPIDAATLVAIVDRWAGARGTAT